MEAVFEAETLMGNEEHQERRRGSDGSPEVCVKPPVREVRNDKAIKSSKKLKKKKVSVLSRDSVSL